MNNNLTLVALILAALGTMMLLDVITSLSVYEGQNFWPYQIVLWLRLAMAEALLMMGWVLLP